MMWMGHKRIEETVLYVNLAPDHTRPTPKEMPAAAEGGNRPGPPHPQDARGPWQRGGND